MNISVNVQPIEIKVTVTEEPLGVSYDRVSISGLAIRELQTVKIEGARSTVASDRVMINKSLSENTYYAYVKHDVIGIPISIHIHFEDQDAELLTTFSVSGNRISFLSFDDVSGLFCTIRYLY